MVLSARTRKIGGGVDAVAETSPAHAQPARGRHAPATRSRPHTVIAFSMSHAQTQVALRLVATINAE